MGQDIALTATQRRSLQTLRTTQKLADRTNERLASGKRVNSVVDDAVNFFRARALEFRSQDFDRFQTDIGQAVQAVEATLDAIDAIDRFLGSLRGLIFTSRSASNLERLSINKQFSDILSQIDNLVDDTSYNGTALLNNTNTELHVNFGLRTNSRQTIQGLDLTRTVVSSVSLSLFSVLAFAPNNETILSNIIENGSFTSIGTNNSNTSFAENADLVVRFAVERLRGHAAKFGIDVAILQVRQDFNEGYINTLKTGSDYLVLADLNEEGANLVALQTRQQIGIQTLAVTGRQQQSIITLLQ